MSGLDATIKCPVCGSPYKAFSSYAGDQSACYSCRLAAEESMMLRFMDSRSNCLRDATEKIKKINLAPIGNRKRV